MKRKILAGLVGLLIAIAPLYAWTDKGLGAPILGHGRTWSEYYNSFWLCDTLIWVNFMPSDDVVEKIVVREDMKAVVFLGEEVVATGELLAVNTPSYDNSKIYPRLQANFDSILLPKGETYRLHLPAGAMALERDTSVVNDPVDIYLKVPEYLFSGTHSIQKGEVVSSKKCEDIEFTIERDIKVEGGTLLNLGTTQMILYRNGVPLREFDSRVSIYGDWGRGFITMLGSGTIYFERGVNYSFVLPEGSVCAMYREDLVNKEERMDFVGGYDQPFSELNHAWSSLNESDVVETLGEVKWSYTQQVALLLAPKIELRNEVHELLKEVIPTLTEVEGEWIMTADFENYAIDSSETYHIIIPGSTVVTPEGDVVVNKESALRIANGVVGINEVNHKALSLACLNNQLHIAGTTEGDHVVLYTVEGRTIASHLAEETNTTLASP